MPKQRHSSAKQRRVKARQCDGEAERDNGEAVQGDGTARQGKTKAQRDLARLSKGSAQLDRARQGNGERDMGLTIAIIIIGIVAAGFFLVLWSCLCMAKRQDDSEWHP